MKISCEVKEYQSKWYKPKIKGYTIKVEEGTAYWLIPWVESKKYDLPMLFKEINIAMEKLQNGKS